MKFDKQLFIKAMNNIGATYLNLDLLAEALEQEYAKFDGPEEIAAQSDEPAAPGIAEQISELHLEPNEPITIHTDGACSGNPGPGGYGIVILQGTERYELSGGEASTTNNRMELTAVMVALRACPAGSEIKLYSDSKYFVDGLTQWLPGWLRNNWKSALGSPVKNKDLWVTLHQLTSERNITVEWVKGHADNKENNRCDELAVTERLKFA